MHYYTFNIGDYRRRTNHLTLLEHGIYRALLDSYYLTESPICSDINKTMRSHCVRTDEEKSALEYVLSEFFEETEIGYVQKSCEEQISKFNEKSESARRSANARWNNANALKDNANASGTQCEGNANQEPITNNQEKEKNSCPPADDPPQKKSKPKKLDKYENDIKLVFEHWHRVIAKNDPGEKLNANRKNKIRARIRDGSVDDLINSINGLAASDWNVKNGITGINYLFQNRETVRRFLTKSLNLSNQKPEEDFKTRMRRELGLGNTYEGETKNV